MPLPCCRAKGGNCTARARELSYTAGDRVTNRKHIYSHSIIVIQSPRNLQEFDKVPQFFGGSKRTLVEGELEDGLLCGAVEIELNLIQWK